MQTYNIEEALVWALAIYNLLDLVLSETHAWGIQISESHSIDKTTNTSIQIKQLRASNYFDSYDALST